MLLTCLLCHQHVFEICIVLPLRTFQRKQLVEIFGALLLRILDLLDLALLQAKLRGLAGPAPKYKERKLKEINKNGTRNGRT